MAKKNEGAPLNANEQASKEQMDAKRAEVTAFYKENIKHLKVQLEYETLMRDIEVARAERLQSQMFIAQSMQGGPNQPPAPPPSSDNKSEAGADWDANSEKAPPRKLKKVEA
jgi:hypothetical protein